MASFEYVDERFSGLFGRDDPAPLVFDVFVSQFVLGVPVISLSSLYPREVRKIVIPFFFEDVSFINEDVESYVAPLDLRADLEALAGSRNRRWLNVEVASRSFENSELSALGLTARCGFLRHVEQFPAAIAIAVKFGETGPACILLGFAKVGVDEIIGGAAVTVPYFWRIVPEELDDSYFETAMMLLNRIVGDTEEVVG